MPKKKSVDRKRSNKKVPEKRIALSGHTFWQSSGHFITSRTYGTNGRTVVLLIATFLLLMLLMSFSAIFSAPSNPAVWATMIFFGGLLLLLLTYEDNIFPNLRREKKIYAIVAWFLAFMVSPYIIMYATTFNFTVFVIIIIFLVFLTPILVRILLPEAQWEGYKNSLKSKVNISRKIKETKSKKKNSELKGVNRKRKIYRR